MFTSVFGISIKYETWNHQDSLPVYIAGSYDFHYIKLTSIFLLLAILLCFASCSKNNEDGQKLKYYTINNEESSLV